MLPYSTERFVWSYSDIPRRFSTPTFSMRPESSYFSTSPPPQRFSIAHVIGASTTIVFSLDVNHHAVPLDRERTPPIRRIVLVHAYGLNPVLVPNAPNKHGIARLEILCRR